MKVFSLPKGLEAPEPDYKNYDHEKEAAAEKAHQDKVKDWLLKNGYPGPNTGKLYREPVADGHAVYMFADGKPAALIHLPYGDGWHSRTVSGMSKKAVLDLIKSNEAMDGFWDRAQKAREGFWESQKVGDIVHYHNSFGQFVRGEIVEHEGKKQMKSIALVGDWKGYDLPQRNADGSIRYSYNAKKVLEGDIWQPSDSCVYEAPSYSESNNSRYGDPREMPAIDLTLPEMDAEEIARANREVLIKKVLEQASHENRSREGDDSLDVMKRMAGILNSYLDLQG